MSVRIVWASLPRCVLPLPSQEHCLKYLLPHAELVIVEKKLRNATDVLSEYKRVKGNLLVLIAPLSVAKTILQKGITPLIPTMDRLKEGDPRSETIQDGIPYAFNRFRWLKRVEVEYEEITIENLLPFMATK